MSADSVYANLNAGTATMEVHNLHLKDYFTGENALVGGGARPKPAVVSFKVIWNAFGDIHHFDNAAQRFRGDFRDANVQIEWSAQSDDYLFESSPLDATTTEAAELGEESNGSFY